MFILVRFEGAPDDPLLRGGVVKGEEAPAVSAKTTEAGAPVEGAVEKDHGECARTTPETEETTRPKKEEVKSLEKTLTNQRLVRSVLSTRIVIPAPDKASNRVIRAVLSGDREALDETVKRKRLKGVAVSLAADDRQRTALHMAVGTKNVRMVQALMQYWRRDLNQRLQDELDFLDHRRDMFIREVDVPQTTDSGRPAGKITIDDVDRFERWMFQERRRLVRVTELRCEECWRKSVTARDDRGRTPLHWAASARGADHSLVHTLITTGRADLSARDASVGRDTAMFADLKAKLRGETPDGRNIPSKRCGGSHGNAPANGNTDMNPAIFPRDGEFHRRTGKLRCLRSSKKECRADGKRDTTNGRDEQHARDSDPRQGPDGLTATTAKVQWFCGALAKTAEKLSMRRRGGAEAFLLSVFEDFDRKGDGTLSMRQFRECLFDVNVRVSEQALLEVGRYFRSPTLKSRSGRHQHEVRDSQRGDARVRRDSATDSTLVEVSYVPLMDVVFGRKDVKESRRKGSNQDDKGTHEPSNDWEDARGYEPRRENKALYLPEAYSIEDDNDNDSYEHCFVDIDRIRAARIAVLETTDALRRPPLFLAAVAGNVPAAKALIRHGAASACAVDGTGFTPHSVAPSLLMRRVLATEARKSLCQALSKRTEDRSLGRCIPDMTSDRKEERELLRERLDHGSELKEASESESLQRADNRRMEMWISTLAEDELAQTRASEARVDLKTSLHLAATAGLPDSVTDLLGRGIGESGKETVGAAQGCAKWDTSWKPSEDNIGRARLSAGHCAYDHHNIPRGMSDAATLATDANGWSALHACCTEDSTQHYSCALALLSAHDDPNARSNTGKTPLHIAASASGSAKSDVIPMLVSHGTSLEAQDADGLRPIHFAARKSRHIALLALLTAGADPWSVTSRRWNALHYSAASGSLWCTRLLAYWDSDSGVLARQENSAGTTAMDLGRTDDIRLAMSTIWEAAALGETERVSRSCQEGSRSPKDAIGKPWTCPGVNSKTLGLGFTPLHACMAGLAAVTRGEDVSLPCTPPRPLNKGDKVAQRPSLYTRLARRCGKPACRHRGSVASTRERNDSGTPELRGKPPGVVDRRDYIGVCRALLSAAADVHALDNRCRTPLALASASGNVEIVEILLRAGADPRARDADGNTPLHFAFSYANVAVAAALSKEGGDQDACNRDGKTPQDVAGLRAGLAIEENSLSGEEPS
ncbi:unnamed protein product [Ectocarpus sp. 4 AP-2014]